MDSYIRVTNLPALTELTACFYFEPSHDDPIDALRTNSLGRMQHLISIASPSKQVNPSIYAYKLATFAKFVRYVTSMRSLVIQGIVCFVA